MMKFTFSIMLFTFFLIYSCGGQTVRNDTLTQEQKSGLLEKSLYDALEKLAKNITNSSYSIVVEDIYLEDSRVIMPLSDYLKNYLMSSSLKTGLFKIVQSRKDFTAISDKTFVYRTDADFDGILLGKYYIEDNGIRIFFTLNKSDSREIIGMADFRIDNSVIPAQMELKPSNYDNYKKFGQDSDLLDKDDFRVTLWTDRGINGIFRDGEKLVVNIRSEEDCYIKLFHAGADGNVKMIFPNKYETNNFINAKTVYKFPDKNMGFEFTLGAPYGIETIRLVAQSAQFDDLGPGEYNGGGPFKDVGSISSPDIKGVYVKGLNVTPDLKTLKKSEACYTYNIVR
jgi:hypothetical protein